MTDRKQELVDAVIEQIKEDIRDNDLTALDEMLKFCPADTLASYLLDGKFKQKT